MTKLQFTDDATTSVGFQVLVALGAVANVALLVLNLVGSDPSGAVVVCAIVALACSLLLLTAIINGRR